MFCSILPALRHSVHAISSKTGHFGYPANVYFDRIYSTYRELIAEYEGGIWKDERDSGVKRSYRNAGNFTANFGREIRRTDDGEEVNEWEFEKILDHGKADNP